MSLWKHALAISLLSSTVISVDLQSVISAYSLNAGSYSFNFPDTTLNSDDASDWAINHWVLNNGHIDWGNADIVFSPDPSTSTSTLVRRQDASTTTTTTSKSSTSHSSTSKSSSGSSTSTMPVQSPASTALSGQPPVLRIEYPQGSYSKRTGGTQFYAQPLNNTGGAAAQAAANALPSGTPSDGQFERMLLSYDVWFPTGFAWNQGGKLPGLRGGPDRFGCSGGSQTNGTGCFSTRLMWRTSGAGEVYAYVPATGSNFCSQSGITCNSDYGTSLGRGSFSFATGKWQTIWLLVILNKVDSSSATANGVVQLYYNGVQALSFTNLLIRSSTSIQSIGGLFFSTFFGGDDSTWATPTTQYTYFRNITMYAGLGAGNATGSSVTAGPVATSAVATSGSAALGVASVKMGHIFSVIAVFGSMIVASVVTAIL